MGGEYWYIPDFIEDAATTGVDTAKTAMTMVFILGLVWVLKR